MHSLAVKLAAVRAARRVRNAEQVHALWQERRRRDTPAYAFGAAIRWHAA